MGYLVIVGLIGVLLTSGVSSLGSPVVRSSSPHTPLSLTVPAAFTSHGPTPSLVASGTNWTNATSGAAPPARTFSAMAYDAKDNESVLFGGYGGTGRVWGNGTTTNDTWVFRGGRWTNLSLAYAPPARNQFAMTYDVKDGYVLLFGGYGAIGALNDTWAFKNNSWTNLTGSVAPSGRGNSAMTYDAADGYVLLFGGWGPLNDTWSYSGGVWTQIATTGAPIARADEALAYDAADRYAVLFGGTNGNGVSFGDTWKYANGTWSKLRPLSSPSKREEPNMAYDPFLGRIVLFGGINRNSGGYRDTWEFTNGSWVNASTSVSPGGREAANLDYDPTIGSLVLFGGECCYRFYNDTWTYGGLGAVYLTVSPSSIDLGQSTTLRIVVSALVVNLSYDYANLPAGCSSANLSTIVCDPTVTGAFAVNVTVTPPLGQSVERSASLAVFPPVQLSSAGLTLAPAVVDIGHSVRIGLTVVNGTGPFRYTYTGLPHGCSSQNTSNLSCTPTVAGEFAISGSVTDPRSEAVRANATLDVNPSPLLNSAVAAPAVVDLGEGTVLSINASGGSGSLAYRYLDLPPGCVSADLPSIGCTSTESGTFLIGIEVTDATGTSANASLELTVHADPAIVSFGPETTVLDVGQSVKFTLNETGGTGPFVVAYSGLPTGCSGSNSTSIACTPQAAGVFSVRADLTDALGLTAVGTASITVNPTPRLNSFAPTVPATDIGSSLGLVVNMSGGTAPLSYAYSGLPRGCGPTRGPIVNCTPSIAGSDTVSVEIRDATGASAGASTRVVVNELPAVFSFDATPSVIELGQNTTFVARVIGGTGPFTYAYATLPPGCSSSQVLEMVCTPTVAGTFNVSVVVTDGVGVEAASNASIEVMAASTGSFGAGSSGTLLVVGTVVLLGAAGGIAVLLLRRRGRPGDPPLEASDERPALDSPSVVDGASTELEEVPTG